MRTIKRTRRQGLIASYWPAIVAFIVAINLVWVARTVINRIPHEGMKLVVRDPSESNLAREHIETEPKKSSSTFSDSSKSKSGDGGSTTTPTKKNERTCRTEYNADYDGDNAIVYGDKHKTESHEACCDACKSNPNCNIWVWCSNEKDGCSGGRAYQECWLKHSKTLNPSNPSGRRSPVLGWISGTVTTEKQYNDAVAKIKSTEQAHTNWLAALRANESLPLVYFDVEIKGEPVGRIEMALFTDISPRCAENFRQFTTGEAGKAPESAGEGAGMAYHFKGAPFYRIIHDFIDQSGVNVESVYGGQFKDDAGGLKLKHTHKGLLSMANMGHDTNTNHFSIMMGPAPHLNGDYTIFGQVVTGFDVVDAVNALSIGKPENTATAEDGAVIVDCGQIRKGTIIPNLDQ